MAWSALVAEEFADRCGKSQRNEIATRYPAQVVIVAHPLLRGERPPQQRLHAQAVMREGMQDFSQRLRVVVVAMQMRGKPVARLFVVIGFGQRPQ